MALCQTVVEHVPHADCPNMDNQSRSSGLYTASSERLNSPVKVPVAVLADVIHLRDGLLFVLGGGVQRITYTALPAPLGRDLGLIIEMTPSECDAAHQVRVVTTDTDGGILAEQALQIVAAVPTGLDPGEPVVVSCAIRLGSVQVPAPGRYGIEVLLDGETRSSLGFRALLRSDA